MTQLVTFTKQGNIGLLALDNPPVNALSHAVREKLHELLSLAVAAPGVEALVIYCEGRTFIAGADIHEFGKPPLAPDLPELVEYLASIDRPVVAAIHGAALGGGLELALACHFRVALPSAKVGLPEVTLGILPGAGGTQRLPRLVGARAALDLIVGGAPISAPKALALGLIDRLIEGDLKAGAIAFAERVVAEKSPLRRLSEPSAKLDSPKLFEDYEHDIRERSRGFLAPFRCIEAVRAAVELPFEQGLARERELFIELMASPQSRAQRHVFFGEREVVKVRDFPADTPARDVRCAAVLGAGETGASIVACFADARIPVTLLESTQTSLDAGLSALGATYAGAVANGALKQTETDERLSRIRATLSYDDLSQADIVIDALSTDTASARAVFAKLDGVCKPGAILAISTPHVDIDQLADETRRPGDVMGIAFRPLASAKLLENVRASRTAPEACASAMKLGKSLGKLPVLARASRGFVGERMFEQGLRESLFLLEEGALPQQIDRVLEDFGFILGPFALSDAAGLDQARLARSARWERLLPRERACDILEKVCALGRLGAKHGAGFHRYEQHGRFAPDTAIEALLRTHSLERGIARRVIPDQEILERYLYAMINEGARILEEGVAVRPLEIDMIWVHGYGFPVYRGGPLFYADELGLRVICEGVRKYAREAGAEYWTPARLLERQANAGLGFYGAA
ncbi:MAG TPA: 3-hydroxyacyl-CoA dehydrogenase NAD-binding domain-containing protein [Polyangiaceae bacterium]|nr:3-hydroxyacyl-CoA dehydrogenase NAD-binding domain-containing protein [Polyangiaceae bacterium]